MFAVGVDAGGTSCKALLAQQQGDWVVIGQGVGGSANMRQVGLENAHNAMRQAIEGAFGHAGLTPRLEDCHVYAGVAGLATPQDQSVFEGWAHPYASLSARSDAVLALDAYFAGAPGVLVIVGTGCIGLARSSQGELFRRMGWGFPLEQGGGAWLGLEVLRIAMGDLENHRPSGLARRLAAELANPRGVMEWIRGKAAGDYARFAPWVFEMSDARLLRLQQDWLGVLQSIYSNLSHESGAVAVGLWGGLADKAHTLWQPGRWQPPQHPPLQWALVQAQLAGQELS